MTSSKGFQHHFNIISKFVCCGCYMKKNAAFALISFAVLKWHECLSFQLPFELTVELPVQLHLELEVNLLVRNVIEREIEREKVQMKPPIDTLVLSILKKSWGYYSKFKNYQCVCNAKHISVSNTPKMLKNLIVKRSTTCDFTISAWHFEAEINSWKWHIVVF